MSAVDIKSAVEALREKGRAAKAASKQMAKLPTEIKNKALHNIADDLLSNQDKILAANEIDCKDAKAAGLSEAIIDRLRLTPDRLKSTAGGVLSVEALFDPVGEVMDMRTLSNGLMVGRKRVPLGVIGAIYESRPNVTIDISALCLKAGNAIILRGGKEAINSNSALVEVVKNATVKAGMPEGAVQFVESTDRSLVNHILKMNDVIDLLVPRGGADLIHFISENASMPVVAGGIGVCHTYVDKSADVDKAVAISYNAKVERPSVCNALDTLIIHAGIAAEALPKIARNWAKAGVEMHCDKRALEILQSDSSLKLVPAVAEDWGREFLALIAAVKVVDSLDEALAHIEEYGSGHSEAIITEEYGAAMRFLNEVDAAAVYANASTWFTDGAQFGLGAEVGISTQKIHARGPVGLRELTSYKWIIFGSGNIRSA